MPTYKANLSVSSIDNLINQVNAYKAKVNQAPNRIVDKLSSIGIQEIESVLSGITDTDGNKVGIVGATITGNKAVVYNQGSQIAYIEYGTGVQGQTSPHPNSSAVGWKYNTGSRIKLSKNGKMQWRYYDKIKGHWRITDGMPAQMQVLRASIVMRSQIRAVVKEVLK